MSVSLTVVTGGVDGESQLSSTCHNKGICGTIIRTMAQQCRVVFVLTGFRLIDSTTLQYTMETKFSALLCAGLKRIQIVSAGT